MSLVPSLLQAIVRIDGEALVMHVGDKPYVVSPKGQVDLATRGLTFDAVAGLLNQLLPQDSQRALDEFGAAQYELPGLPEFPGEHFTVVAARGGDDVWVEIRRRKVPDDDLVPMELFGPAGTPATAAAPARGEDRRRVTGESPAAPEAETEHELTFDDSDDLTLPKPDEMFGDAESRREPVAAPASADHEPAWHPLAAVHPAEATPVAMQSTAAPSAAEPEQPDTSPAPAEPVWTPAPVAVHEPDAVAVAGFPTKPLKDSTQQFRAGSPPPPPGPPPPSGARTLPAPF